MDLILNILILGNKKEKPQSSFLVCDELTHLGSDSLP